MPLAAFHPLVQQWFRDTLGEPTAAQRRGWESVRAGRHTLIAAPTGSGKTLAAFLSALDDLFRASLEGPLPDEVRVVYVSPLKALSADIHKNLAEPRRGIRLLAEQAGLQTSRITAAVRTGDTPQSERAAMLRTPPHILVTTPESLYLLLTSERSRNMLRTARTVIVDEIHAVIGTRRGAHLALSLERLRQVCDGPLLRLGLSATQKPLDEVATFLVGGRPPEPCTIVDEGHRRAMDLGVELPRSSLDAVMAHEVWEEYYDRLEELIAAHRTTLVFVNTRRMAERLARHLSDRLGEEAVTAHHGSLSKEKRLDAETRLKSGALRALVATASLELGIDIGHVDLVCQIGSPHRIATLLQRVGRSGHTVAGMPKGRLFPVTRDDLIECAALLRAVRRGELDAIVHQEAPLDVLAQQVVAECACREYAESELFELVRTAAPYRALPRADFDAVIAMAADGFSTRRGRRAALLHRDEVNGTVRGRRGSRLLAITSGGAIPELADYRVVLEPEETFIGTLNEDFAIESMAGDVFQLGNASWRVLQVTGGTVRVEDAHGVPPNIPFWFGEAPARSDELSQAVSELRADTDAALSGPAGTDAARVVEWFAAETGTEAAVAEQAVEYLAEGRRALGVIPSRETLVLERFFDESGGMQLVLHAPFGSRVNKAWGLALRKRFCRQFNFELQAAATEDALLLSLGPQHSFPLSDVFRYLHPETTRDVLVQAFLDAPVFKTRWRWNTTVALAVPRNRGGRKVAPQLQRMLADDLMAAVFPDAAACLENIPGDRQIPDHPLVKQTIEDCLQEAMDFEGLRAVLASIHRGELTMVARDTPEPSVFAHEILNAKPYAFLDDAPLEERRTQAVMTRRAGEPSSAGDLGALDPAAIERVRDEVRPEPVDPHEMHDVLMSAGFVLEGDLPPAAREHLQDLRGQRRATPALPPHGARIWLAAERIPELRAVVPGIEVQVEPPASRAARAWTRDDALVELLRGRLMFSGPVTAAALAAPLGLTGPTWRRHSSPSRARGSSCVGGFRPRREREFPDAGTERGPREWSERGGPGEAARSADIPPEKRMVRPVAAGAHPSLHAQPPARGNRAGHHRGLHAFPVRVAAPRAGDAADRARRAARSPRRARRVRTGSGRMGADRAAGAHRRLRAIDAGHAVPERRDRVDAPVGSHSRFTASAARPCNTNRPLPARTPRRLAREPRRRSAPGAHAGGPARARGSARARRVVPAGHRVGLRTRHGCAAAGDRGARRQRTGGLGWLLRLAQPADDRAAGHRARAQPIHRPVDSDTGAGVLRGPGRVGADASLGTAAALRRRFPATDDSRSQRSAVAGADARVPASRSAR